MERPSPSLLVVHNNVNMGKTLAVLLARDYDVFVARSSSQAAHLMANNEIQMVLAGMTLPDGTGLDLLSDIRRRSPQVVRILLLEAGEKESIDLDRAINNADIHRYLTEPLTNARFLETVKRGLQLFNNGSSGRTGNGERKPDVYRVTGAPQVDREDAVPVTPSDLQPPKVSEADSLEASSRSYEAVMRGEMNAARVVSNDEGNDGRIEQLQSALKKSQEDQDRLLTRLAELQKETAVVGVLRRENARLAGELESALGRVRSLEAVGSHAPPDLIRPDELMKSIDPMDIYGKAAEWLGHIHRLSRLNDTLQQKLRKCELEAEDAQEQALNDRSRLEAGREEILRRLREYEEQLSALRQRNQTLQESCDRLERDKDALGRKLEWVQSRWKAMTDTGETV